MLTSSVAIRPAVEVRYRRTVGKVRLEPPINDKRCIFVGGILWADDQTA